MRVLSLTSAGIYFGIHQETDAARSKTVIHNPVAKTGRGPGFTLISGLKGHVPILGDGKCFMISAAAKEAPSCGMNVTAKESRGMIFRAMNLRTPLSRDSIRWTRFAF